MWNFKSPSTRENIRLEQKNVSKLIKVRWALSCETWDSVGCPVHVKTIKITGLGRSGTGGLCSPLRIFYSDLFKIKRWENTLEKRGFVT